jgi:hypothetical protein
MYVTLEEKCPAELTAFILVVCCNFETGKD